MHRQEIVVGDLLSRDDPLDDLCEHTRTNVQGAAKNDSCA